MPREGAYAQSTQLQRQSRWESWQSFVHEQNFRPPYSWEQVYLYEQWLVDNDIVTKDHISTVTQRLKDQDLLRQSTYCHDQEQQCKQSIKLYEGAHSVAKAPPPQRGPRADLPARHRAQSDVWISCGARAGGFMSIIPSRADSSIIPGWTRLPMTVSKRVRSELTEESVWVPTFVWLPAAQYFPISQSDVDLICHQFKCRTHSFRRGLAVSLRIQIANIGYLRDADIPKAMTKRLADIFTWKTPAMCAAYWKGWNSYHLSTHVLLTPPRQVSDYIIHNLLPRPVQN